MASAASTHPAPSEYIAIARTSFSSLAALESEHEPFQDADLHLGHIVGVHPPRGIQVWPHTSQRTSSFGREFHSDDLHDGHLRGGDPPRLIQVWPHFMHQYSSRRAGGEHPSRKDMPQYGHTIISSGSLFMITSPEDE